MAEFMVQGVCDWDYLLTSWRNNKQRVKNTGTWPAFFLFSQDLSPCCSHSKWVIPPQWNPLKHPYRFTQKCVSYVFWIQLGQQLRVAIVSPCQTVPVTASKITRSTGYDENFPVTSYSVFNVWNKVEGDKSKHQLSAEHQLWPEKSYGRILFSLKW